MQPGLSSQHTVARMACRLSCAAAAHTREQPLLSPAGCAASLSARNLTPRRWQAFSAARQAGSQPHLVHARLDVQRFASVNQAKGRWALLDRLAWAPEAAAGPPGPAQAHVAVAPQPARPAVFGWQGVCAAGMSLEAVQKVVSEAVVTIWAPSLKVSLLGLMLPALCGLPCTLGLST